MGILLFNNIKKYLLPFIFGMTLAFRFLYLDFGIPEVLQADEVEMAEYSLRYAVNIKKFFEGDLYYFKPFSFVYGSLPAYTNTILFIPFLKFTSYFDLSQDRFYIYLYLRIWYAFFSVLACIGVLFLAKQITKNKEISYLAAILFSLNFYYFWLSKYLNNDNLIVLFTVYFLLFYLKFTETQKTKFLYLSMIFVGLGVATKITFLVVLLFPFFELALKKAYKKLSISLTIVFFVYLITNPFTFVFPIEFLERVLEMRYKENGVVIDSYNTSYFKYIFSLFENLTIPVVILGFFQILYDLKNKKFNVISSLITIFIIFFSISQRLVERWLLPIYPLLIIYFFIMLSYLDSRKIRNFVIGLVFVLTIINFVNTNIELSKGSTLQKAYYDFMEFYTAPGKIVYIVTERGLNPFGYVSKKGMFYAQAPVVLYESEGAFSSFPDNPEKYDFVVFSTRVREYYMNPYIFNINPSYVEKWESFFNQLTDKNKFEVLSFYGNQNKSLLNQENIIIFKKKTSN